MSKKLTLDDLIIEEHPGGQNCRSCPLIETYECECMLTYSGYSELKTNMLDKYEEVTCLTHTIILKPTTNEQL